MFIYLEDYYFVMKRNEILEKVGWINFEKILFFEKGQIKKVK